MQQSHTHDPSRPIDLPPCPKCENRMWLACIEPTDKPDYDQRTFECPRCDHSETTMVKFKQDSQVERQTRSNKGPMTMMLYQPATPRSDSIKRPNCSDCGTVTHLFGIEPERPGYELLTFVCPRCEHIETAVGKAK